MFCRIVICFVFDCIARYSSRLKKNTQSSDQYLVPDISEQEGILKEPPTGREEPKEEEKEVLGRN